MITAKELRIGNYLSIIGITPIKIDAQRILSISNGDTDYQQIPINEEWLLKFGFEKMGLYYHFPDSFFKLEQYKNKNAFWLRSGTEHLDCVRINYVHQLQNLYFALTGTELTLK
jgi:hypothetical protein